MNRNPHIFNQPFLHSIADPRRIFHVESQIHLGVHFINILSTGSAGSIVSDIELIQRNESVEL